MKTIFKCLSVIGMVGVPVLSWAMTAAQTSAFQTANSGGASITAQEVNTLFSGLVGAVAFLWFCWVLMCAYKSWASNSAQGHEAMWQVLRALFVLIVTVVVVN